MRDFFISYRRSDKAWAEWIAWQLERAGYSVYIQAWDFSPGNSIMERMQTGLTDCKHTLAIISPNYLTSEYTEAEWQTSLNKDITGKERRLIPVLIEKCEMPGFLKPLVYINLADITEEDKMREALLEGVKPAQRPSSPPLFPLAMPVAPRSQQGGTRPNSTPRGVTFLRSPSPEALSNELQKRPGIVGMIGETSDALDLLSSTLRPLLRHQDATLTLDFNTFDASVMQSKSALCHAVISSLRRQLSKNLPEEELWDDDAGDIQNLHNFVRNHVVPKTDSHAYLIVTGITPLLTSGFKDEVFALWRSWHTARSTDYRVDWSRLTLILITNSDPNTFITNPNTSPFNVGTWVML